MLYNPPTGGAANDPYVGKNVAAGIQGSKVPPGAVEFPQRELLAIIAADPNLSPTNTDLGQAQKSIAYQIAQAVAAVPKATAFGATAEGGLKLDANNNFLLALLTNLTADNRTAPVAGDVLALGRAADGLMVSVSASALASYILSNIVSTNTFQQVAVNPVLYVRTDGNDANNGLSNTAGGAFKTIAAALAKGTSAYSFSSSQLTIQLGIPGTYAAPSTPYLPTASGTVNISGDATNAANYIIAGATTGGQYVFITSSIYVFSGLTIQNNDATSGGTIAVQGPTYLVDVNLVSTTNNTTGAHLFVGSALTIEAGCTASGNMKWLFFGSNFASITVGQTFQILGNVTFSGSTMLLTNLSQFQLLNGATISASGTVTGTRYVLGNNSVANMNGAGANAIPGSAAGTVSNAIYNP